MYVIIQKERSDFTFHGHPTCEKSSTASTLGGRSSMPVGRWSSVLWIILNTSLRFRFDRSFSGFLYLKKFTLQKKTNIQKIFIRTLFHMDEFMRIQMPWIDEKKLAKIMKKIVSVETLKQFTMEMNITYRHIPAVGFRIFYPDANEHLKWTQCELNGMDGHNKYRYIYIYGCWWHIMKYKNDKVHL